MRGFKSIGTQEDTPRMKADKQRNYAVMIKLSKREESEKVWLKRPPYCIGKAREEWEEQQKKNKE